MSLEKNCVDISFVAGVDLSAKQYHFVSMSADGQIDPVAAAGADALGILKNKPDAAGKAAAVTVWGIAKVVAGATLAPGDKVRSSATGQAVAQAASSRELATVITGGVANDMITVLLKVNHLSIA